MLVLHELEEVVIGDLTLYDKGYDEKWGMGRQAVQKVLGNLTKKDEYLELVEEFNMKETKEAQFAYFCDKLEADLQVKRYEEEGVMDMHHPKNASALEDERIQKQISQ
jgi:5'-deoxynucleotidase YfbR-like HD superfamily hydrolase